LSGTESASVVTGGLGVVVAIEATTGGVIEIPELQGRACKADIVVVPAGEADSRAVGAIQYGTPVGLVCISAVHAVGRVDACHTARHGGGAQLAHTAAEVVPYLTCETGGY
jgi:hypothetical protein